MRAIITIVAVLTAGAPLCLAQPTTQWRGQHHNGHYQGAIHWPDGGPRVLWEANIGIGYAGFAATPTRVYTVGNVDGEDVIDCLDAASGAVVWSQRYPQDLVPLYNPGGPNASPTLDGPWLYTLSKQGLVTCWSAADGSVRWRVDLLKGVGATMPRWGFASTPLILDDVIYLNANQHGIALNKDTGAVVWNSPADESGYGAPVEMTCRGEKALAILGTRTLFVVRQSDGMVMWKVDWPTKMGENSADPTFADGKLYVSSWWDMGAAQFDPNLAGHEPLWRNKAFQNHIAAPVLFEGHLYGFDGPVHRRNVPGALRCVEWATGRTIWSQPDMKGSLILVGRQLLILTNDGSLVLADANPDGYRERGRLDGLGKRTWNAPVLLGEHVYVRDADGKAICVDLSASAQP
ncbi:MAG: PQQ-binding-like beta-propeller repeat protein [Planctomycetes bacterium]|nr:PQQ-binding-like beta-propeller repeat protein [Planctomycetota bacterium]